MVRCTFVGTVPRSNEPLSVVRRSCGGFDPGTTLIAHGTTPPPAWCACRRYIQPPLSGLFVGATMLTGSQWTHDSCVVVPRTIRLLAWLV